MVQEITTKAQFDEVVKSGKVVLIDYYAEWCGPCKMISPIFDKHAEQHSETEDVEFYKVNVDTLPEVAAERGITAMPTFHAYKNNEKVHQLVGANPAGLQDFVQTGLGHRGL